MVLGGGLEAVAHVGPLSLQADDEVGGVEDQAERLRQLVQQVGKELHRVVQNSKKS